MDDSRDYTVLLVVLLIIVVLVGGGGGVYWAWRGIQESRIARLEAMAAAAAADRTREQAALESERAVLLIERAVEERRATSKDAQVRIEEGVRRVLDAQQAAWNAGDVEGFMEHYWKSDELSFNSGGTVTRGWEATLENYKERYPSREAMGTLTFDNLNVRAIAVEAALVLGDWQIVRGDETLGGNFSLVFQKLDGRWVIIHDHTSRVPAP
jgi:beta-aspartyl-peptidase (threonine type)